MPSDRYDDGYAAKLWQLLPAIYRAEDPPDLDHRGPLEEIVRRIGAQVAIVRRSIDRLWEDQSIESCDDWVIPYIGELLATNLVASLDARGQRLDVAKTVYYRRRKGTVALLEELATDVTGWGVRVVEMFRRLGRTRHGLDPAIGRPTVPAFSRVTARNASPGTLNLVGTPVAPHAVQVRIDIGGQAGVAAWSTSIDGAAWISQGAARIATIDAAGGGTVTITLVDGASAPSFITNDVLSFTVTPDAVARLQRAQHLIGAQTRTPAGGLADLRDVEGARQSRSAFDEFSHTVDVRRGRGVTGWHDIPRLGVFAWRLRSFGVEQVTPVAHATCAGHYTFDPTGRDIALFAAGDRPIGDAWVSPGPHQLPAPLTDTLIHDHLAELYRTDTEQLSLALYRVTAGVALLVPRIEISTDRRLATGKPWIDAPRGRVMWPAPPTDGPYVVDYHYGFASEIGAGPYERPGLADEPPAVAATVSGGGAALAAVAVATGTIAIADSLTYTAAPALTITDVVVQAGDQRRPLVRLAPGTAWTLTGASADATLALDGLWVSGGDVVLAGSFARVTVSACTLDPGTRDGVDPTKWARSADARDLVATTLRIDGEIEELLVDRSITGPIVMGTTGRVEKLRIRETIVQAAEPGKPAIVAPADVDLARTTVLGPAQLHRLHASECIFDEPATVDDCQHGCVRFCAYAAGSTLPRRYESVEVPLAGARFTSRTFGDAAFAQLAETVGAAIAAGAEDGSEMGAFWREKNAIKDRSLLIKYQEFLPLGLEPVIVHVT
jgi:hypothetical protein